MKITWITSFPPLNSGIATYSSYLYKDFPIEVAILKWNFKNKLTRLFGPIVYLNRIRGGLKGDIVHIQYHLGEQMFLFLPLIYILPKRAKIIMTLHEDYANLHPAIIFFHNLFYSVADKLIIHTNSHKHYLSKSQRNKAVLIPHGIIKRGTKPEQENYLLIPGFINEWKGIETAIKAVYKLKNKIPGIKLIIAGKTNDKRYSNSLKELTKEYNLNNEIEFIDKFIEEEEFQRLISKAKICIFPYTRITMSGALCHAISWNIPSITSDLEEFQYHLKNKGCFFKRGNSNHLAEQLFLLLTNENMRKQLKENFNQLSKEYSWKKIGEITYQLYKEVNQKE